MELDKCIIGRRTVRHFNNKSVSWMLVAEILNSGNLAPSSGNIQNWYFVVVRSKEQREKVLKYCDGNNKAINAPILIIICADTNHAKRLYGSRGELLYSPQNCACAAMQMMLKAYDLGLATAWIGSFDDRGLAEALEMDRAKPLIILALGYGESKYTEPKRDDVSLKIFFEKFGEKERKGDYSMLPLSTPLRRNIDPMKEKIKSAFDSEFSQEHKEKVKKFVDRFKLKSH